MARKALRERQRVQPLKCFDKDEDNSPSANHVSIYLHAHVVAQYDTRSSFNVESPSKIAQADSALSLLGTLQATVNDTSPFLKKTFYLEECILGFDLILISKL